MSVGHCVGLVARGVAVGDGSVVRDIGGEDGRGVCVVGAGGSDGGKRWCYCSSAVDVDIKANQLRNTPTVRSRSTLK